MACIHRFAAWLNLPLSLVDWEVNTLIVGTFNPGWEANNYASWFYGRTDNNYLWEVLPEIYGEQSLRKPYNNEAWIAFCRQYGIAFTDLINTIEDADETNVIHRQLICGNQFSDTAITDNFKELRWTPVVEILQSRPLLRHVYLTRSAGGIWGKEWRPVQEYCWQNQLDCKTLLTPSGNARFQYNRQMQEQYPTLGSYILARWQQCWHAI